MIKTNGENLVFLLGVPRSGTTLLSVMLDGHSSVRCPPEPWLMLALESLGRVSARNPADAPVLYRAMKEFCDPETSDIAARHYATTAYNQVLSGTGKNILVDKTPRYYLILPYLQKIFPAAKYVILWRNPLDIAASIRTTWDVDLPSQLDRGEDHLACIDLVAGLRNLLDFSNANPDRVFSLQYERLARQPQKFFNSVVKWLGLPPEQIRRFKLSGGEFDKAEIGDKKILVTAAAHQNSIDRWKQTFTVAEAATVINSIGPHIFRALGYEHVVQELLRDGIPPSDPAHSNAYAQRLERSIARTASEYDAVETFCDLTIHERSLYQALLGSTQPASIDLATGLRLASDSARKLSAQFAQQLARSRELENQSEMSAARLDESRNLVQLHIENAASHQAEWFAKFQSLEKQVEEKGEQVTSLQEQITSLEERLTTHQHLAEETTGKLLNAEKTITVLRRPEPNRRTWPYAASGSTRLPQTLPGGKPWPRITVVTPSFNQGCYIEQTILSVLGQNYPNLEFFIIDGGSSDQTMSVVNRYRDKIDFVVSEKDSGQSNAINRGFKRATGDLLTWINSDDMFESGALAAMAMAFHTSGADIVAGVCTLHTGGVVASRHLTSCSPGPLPLNKLLDLDHCWLKGQFFYQPEVMFTRALWERAGGYLDENLYYSLDYDLWLRFAVANAQLHVIGRPIALYRIHEKQKTFRMEDYHPELLAVRNKFHQHFTKETSRTNGSVPRTHLRVLFFNDLGNAGGAGIAHQRLALSFALAGHEVIPIAISPNLNQCTLSNQAILHAIADRNPDIVFLGNIHSAQLDPAIIGLIAERWPTVQVLHDLYSLTGRCAYTGDCARYLTGCDENCPTSNEYPTLDPVRIANAWKSKNDAMSGGKSPIIAAVSTWTQHVAHRRFETVNLKVVDPPQRKPQIMRIRYGIPTETFTPRDKSTCRHLSKLPQNRFIVLFSSSHLSDERKGLRHLLSALEFLQLPDLLAVGIGQQDVEFQSHGFEFKSVGYIEDNDALANLYSAADLFVGPSLIETFGQVFIEAAACGTPSIGFATAGGVADAIADDLSGCLAHAETSAELANLIKRLYDAPDLRSDMGRWARLWIENEYSLRSSYQRLFSQLNTLGVIDSFSLAPKVTFFHQTIAQPAITYLDPPPPPPDFAALFGHAQNRISSLELDRDLLQTQNSNRIAKLEAERVSNQQEITNLQLENRDLLTETKTRILQLESDRDSLRANASQQISALETERESLRISIQNITQTRLWRIVAAIYPTYQQTLGTQGISRFLTWPIRTAAGWLSDRKSP